MSIVVMEWSESCVCRLTFKNVPQESGPPRDYSVNIECPAPVRHCVVSEPDAHLWVWVAAVLADGRLQLRRASYRHALRQCWKSWYVGQGSRIAAVNQDGTIRLGRPGQQHTGLYRADEAESWILSMKAG